MKILEYIAWGATGLGAAALFSNLSRSPSFSSAIWILALVGFGAIAYWLYCTREEYLELWKLQQEGNLVDRPWLASALAAANLPMIILCVLLGGFIVGRIV